MSFLRNRLFYDKIFLLQKLRKWNFSALSKIFIKQGMNAVQRLTVWGKQLGTDFTV